MMQFVQKSLQCYINGTDAFSRKCNTLYSMLFDRRTILHEAYRIQPICYKNTIVCKTRIVS